MASIQEKSRKMREELVDGLLDLMERDGLRWRQGFDPRTLLPRNGVTGMTYRGVNRMNLAFRALVNGWKDPRWATLHQANLNGWKVKKGSKASLVEKWGVFRVGADEDPKGSDGKPDGCKVVPRLQKVFFVFNFEQLEGPEPLPSPNAEAASFELADRLILSSECEVVEAARGSACYMPGADRIVMPPRAAFESEALFVQTLTHEMAHSTGHRSRLDREALMQGAFGSPEYAEEELRAEFASAFLGAALGVDLGDEVMEGHAAYLQSWLKAAREDGRVLTDAIAEAERIADYLIGNLEAAEDRDLLCA